jgi:two-component system cell cycle response regulator CtrA
LLVLYAGSSDRSEQALRASAHDQFQCEQVAGGRDLLDFLDGRSYAMAVIELKLTDMSGIEAVRMLRRERHSLPVLLVGDFATAEVKAMALDEGADDVLTGEYKPCELQARMRALVRRRFGHAQSALRCGPLELHWHLQAAYVDGRKLDLTRREYEALSTLFMKQGAVVSKARLLESLYGAGEEPEPKAIDVIICRLRKKLAKAGAAELIGTEWGGYILRPAEESARRPAMVDLPPAVFPLRAPMAMKSGHVRAAALASA